MYTGKLVRLREYRIEDLKLRLEYINDPEIAKFMVADTPYPLTMHEEEEWFRSISAFKDTYRFAIEALDSTTYIGGCSINGVDWKNSSVSIGMFIGNKDYLRKGYGSDALRTLVAFIFSEMNINKIRLYVYSFNKQAIKCYERCGFKKEGVLRQEIYRNGRFHDTIVMGILRNEFIEYSNAE